MLSCWFPNLQLRSAACQNAALLGSSDTCPSCFFWGGIFSLAYLMFAVCKAISFYMKKASYNWKFIAEKCSVLPRKRSFSWCANIMCTYASYQGRERAPVTQLQTISFSLAFLTEGTSVLPLHVLYAKGRKPWMPLQKKRHKTRCRMYRDLTT